MKNLWVLGIVAGLSAASMAAAQQPLPYPPPGSPLVACVPPPGAVPPPPGAMPPPGGVPQPGVVPPPYGMMPPPGPMMPPPGMPPTPYNVMPPPGSMQGMPGYGAIPYGGPPQAPPLEATGGTAVPPCLGAPTGYMPVDMPACQEPARIAPGLRGSYTAFTEESPLFRAHNCEFWDGCRHCYLDVGWLWLNREPIGNSVFAVRDTSTVETNPMSSSGQVLLQPSDASSQWQSGIRAELGIFGEYCNIGLSGFWIPMTGNSITKTDTARIDTFFVNPPVGFTGTGNNGLFLHADQVTEHFQTELYSADAMVRGNAFGLTGVTLLAGVRYFGNFERFQIDAIDDLATPQSTTLQAEYTVRVQNHIVAPQFGVDIFQPFGNYYALSIRATTAPGVDFAHSDTSLIRGDGLVGLTDAVNRVQFAELFDVAASLDLFLADSIRVRLGYTIFWAVNVAEAVQNVDFDLNNRGKYNEHGSVFYHGPTASITFRF